jgi:bifunctional ADP-heptose synthase (sugar kinase/adenylyltransferase)
VGETVKILVVGDAMTDLYHEGKVVRLNPEKHSVPLVSIERRLKFPGGAANVAANLRALGAEVVLVTGRGEITKHRVLDEDGVVCRFDVGDELEPIQLLPDASTFDAVVVSDYAKGSITDSVVLEIQKKFLVPTFVDTKKNPYPWMRGKFDPTCIFPNAAEYKRHTREYGVLQCLLIKQGSLGATLVRSNRKDQFQSTASCAANATGAGDTVISAFTFAYLQNKDRICYKGPENVATLFAMDAAALAVSSKFTAAPTFDEILQAFPERRNLYVGGLP